MASLSTASEARQGSVLLARIALLIASSHMVRKLAQVLLELVKGPNVIDLRLALRGCVGGLVWCSCRASDYVAGVVSC